MFVLVKFMKFLDLFYLEVVRLFFCDLVVLIGRMRLLIVILMYSFRISIMIRMKLLVLLWNFVIRWMGLVFGIIFLLIV